MLEDLFFEYFCKPVVDSSVQGYNFVNTGVYALILFVVTVYAIYPFINKKGIKFDFQFVTALIPYIIFGSALRVLNDMGAFTKTCSPLDVGFWTFTPGIWFLTAGITVLGLLIAHKYGKNNFHKLFAGIGALVALPIVLYEISIFKAWFEFALVLVMVAIITGVVKVIVELWKKDFFKNKLNLLVVAGQALDGCATFVATDILSCGEQHPLSESILAVHPALFILVKVSLALLIVYYIDRDLKDKNFAGFVKMTIIILGIATGGRDLLTLAVGTCGF